MSSLEHSSCLLSAFWAACLFPYTCLLILSPSVIPWPPYRPSSPACMQALPVPCPLASHRSCGYREALAKPRSTPGITRASHLLLPSHLFPR